MLLMKLSFSSFFIIFIQCMLTEAKTRYPPGVKPPQIEFDIFNIKTPQLIGIIFGVLVFTLTIGSVVMLLYKSGTLSRFQSEIQSGKPLKINLGSKTSVTPQTSGQPELYDHLIEASQTLPASLTFPLIKGKYIQLRQYDEKTDLTHLYEASNGDACFHESAYDPLRLWGWLPNFEDEIPSRDLETLRRCLRCEIDKNSTHLVIVDPTLQKAVGMLSLIKNSPSNLSIQIGI